MRCKYKENYIIYKETIDNLIISDILKIEDLPFELRVSDKLYYIYAFRFARYNYERFVFINKLLDNDFSIMNYEQKRKFLSFYQSAKDNYYAIMEQFEKKRITGIT